MRRRDEHGCLFANLEFVNPFIFPIPVIIPGVFFSVHSVSVIEEVFRVSLGDLGRDALPVFAHPIVDPDPMSVGIDQRADKDHRDEHDEPDQVAEPLFVSFVQRKPIHASAFSERVMGSR